MPVVLQSLHPPGCGPHISWGWREAPPGVGKGGRVTGGIAEVVVVNVPPAAVDFSVVLGGGCRDPVSLKRFVPAGDAGSSAAGLPGWVGGEETGGIESFCGTNGCLSHCGFLGCFGRRRLGRVQSTLFQKRPGWQWRFFCNQSPDRGSCSSWGQWETPPGARGRQSLETPVALAKPVVVDVAPAPADFSAAFRDHLESLEQRGGLAGGSRYLAASLLGRAGGEALGTPAGLVVAQPREISPLLSEEAVGESLQHFVLGKARLAMPHRPWLWLPGWHHWELLQSGWLVMSPQLRWLSGCFELGGVPVLGQPASQGGREARQDYRWCQSPRPSGLLAGEAVGERCFVGELTGGAGSSCRARGRGCRPSRRS